MRSPNGFKSSFDPISIDGVGAEFLSGFGKDEKISLWCVTWHLISGRKDVSTPFCSSEQTSKYFSFHVSGRLAQHRFEGVNVPFKTQSISPHPLRLGEVYVPAWRPFKGFDHIKFGVFVREVYVVAGFPTDM